MKKASSYLIIGIIILTMLVSISIIGCKQETVDTAAAETAAAETTAAETTAAETTAEEEVVAGEEGLFPALDLTVYFMSMGKAGDFYHETIAMGARDAAKLYNIDLKVFYAEGDIKTEVDQLESAISAKPNGICVYLSDETAFDDPVARAVANGIPVIAVSLDDPSENARTAFVGPDLLQDGYNIANAMIGYLKEGDHVLIPSEVPSMVYSTLRAKGIQAVLSEKNITSEVFDASYEVGEVLARISAYLLGHPETDGIIGVGALVTSGGGQAVKDLGLKDQVSVGGFDLNIETLDLIKEGYIQATADAQPYLIGFLSVQQFFFNTYAGFNFVDINTATGIVDINNVDAVIKYAKTGLR